jgi:hypothetical protein
MKCNYFATLNESLESENVINLWPIGSNIDYGQTVRHIVADHLSEIMISVYRSTTGNYERPVYYRTKEVLNQNK